MTKLKEELLLKTPVFEVVKKTFKETDFQPVGINCADWCMVIVTDNIRNVKDSKLLAVRQTRWGVENITVEFPCGTAENGELAVDTALRELKEETGLNYDKNNVIVNIPFNPNPAYFNNNMHCVIIEDTKLIEHFEKRGNQKLDKTEDCEPAIVGFEDMFQFCNHGLMFAGMAQLLYASMKLR